MVHALVRGFVCYVPDELVALGRLAGKRGYTYSDVPWRQKTSLGNQQITGGSTGSAEGRALAMDRWGVSCHSGIAEIEGLQGQEAPQAAYACVRAHQSDIRHDRVGAASTKSARFEDGLRICGRYRLITQRERERGGRARRI